ncbi:MAG: fluoride efflux transporter CrcB [Oscillochloris sp.]|nr:fluoride efflux transporter CrcB [Oscillochloris sp.]
MQNMLAIAIGAAIGANLRYGITIWAVERFGVAWYGTFIVNIAGCLVIGILLTLANTRLPLAEPLRLFLVTGLLGSLTTFSSFSYEGVALVSTGKLLEGALYIGTSVLVGIGAVVLGVWLARLFTS